jgi:mono/diheme cytochrome c family protein
MKPYLSLLLALFLSGLSTAALAMDQAGQAVFEEHCFHCHAPGLNRPGTMQLSVTRGAAYALLEQRSDLSVDYIKYIVRHGLRTMPGFKPTTLTNAELDALASYLSK